MKPDRRTVRFVRALLSAGEAIRDGDHYRCAQGAKAAGLGVSVVGALAADGLLCLEAGTCRPTRDTRSWLKRQLAEGEGHAAQHRVTRHGPDGLETNMAESPLARLALGKAGAPAFLAPHQFEAGERLRRLIERAHMVQRITMSYDAARVASEAPGAGGDIDDMALDARRELAGVLEQLPRDCAGVLLDVCGYLKGLQQVETERQWPRRSAKLVLRIALEQAARHYGLAATATGPTSSRKHAWVPDDALPTEIG